jgi:hypothetical protein
MSAFGGKADPCDATKLTGPTQKTRRVIAEEEWDEALRTFRKTPLHNWASHEADAFRYLAMSWRLPIASEPELSPLERLRQEVMKPRTYNDIYKQYADELRDRGHELEGHEELFNLNDMEMK